MYICTTNSAAQHGECQITPGSAALWVTSAYACAAYELIATGITQAEPFLLCVSKCFAFITNFLTALRIHTRNAARSCILIVIEQICVVCQIFKTVYPICLFLGVFQHPEYTSIQPWNKFVYKNRVQILVRQEWLTACHFRSTSSISGPVQQV